MCQARSVRRLLRSLSCSSSRFSRRLRLGRAGDGGRLGQRPVHRRHRLDGLGQVRRRPAHGRRHSTDSLQSAADDVKSATATLESDLKDLGKPDTEAGQEAKDAIDQLSSDLTTSTESIRDAVDGVSSISGIVGAVATIGTTLATMQSQVTTTDTTLKGLDAKGELQDAFEQASACQQLSSSS